jgi:hypothetical protein
MFKPTRTIAGLVAITAVAGTAAAGVAMPSSADAAARCYWEIPSSFEIGHSNGWTVETGSKIGKFKWQVDALHPGVNTESGKLKLTRFDTSGVKPKVEFTVTLSNGSTGVYRGTINRRGFIKGTTTDEFHPGSSAGFWVLEPVDCV